MGRAAYIVLAGPSLERNLGESPPRDGDVVIAVNSSAVRFSKVVGRSVDWWLVCDGVVRPGIFAEWGGVPQFGNWALAAWCDPRLVEHFHGTPPHWFRTAGLGHEQVYCGVPIELPELEYSFNTGSMTLHFADLLGCNPIVFVGADAAMTGGHFRPGERAHVSCHSAMAAPDIDNYWTLTRIDQFIAARKMETWAWMLAKYGVKVVNLTGAGIMGRFMERKRPD